MFSVCGLVVSAVAGYFRETNGIYNTFLWWGCVLRAAWAIHTAGEEVAAKVVR